MNSVQIHLALTHVPVILSLMGVVMLIVALLLKNNMLVKTSYVIIIIAGIAALPVYFSGEGAEEAVEHLPGVSENVIEKHEDVAKAAMISIVLSGMISLIAFFSFQVLKAASGFFKIAVVGAGLISGVLLFQTAKLGGEIRHTEVSNSTAAAGSDNERNQANTSDDDD